MCRIISVANQKGGVGKTTTAINFATSLALAEQRVLVVDIDPQGNLTSGVGLKGQATAGRDDLSGAHAQDPIEDSTAFILETPVKNLWLIPADRNLTGAEIELVTLPHREAPLARSPGAAARSLRLHPRRHAAVARPAHAERAGRRRRRAHSAQLRVLRARRTRRSRRDLAARPRRD